jgi:hypothetical protein
MGEEVLKPQEKELIKTIRGIKFGALTIKIQNGIPVHGEKIKEDIDFNRIVKEQNK